MKIIGIIPARFASTRLHGKPLVDLGGKTMIQRVYDRVRQSKLLQNVVVATDDTRIFNHVKTFGGEVVMTAPTHQSGTERCAEALHHLLEPFDWVINIQGDEPHIHPEQVDALADFMSQNSHFDIGTLCKRIESSEELFNPNVVKVVRSPQQTALYFSRQPIPFLRGYSTDEWLANASFLKHLGLYAYRPEILLNIVQLPVSPLEAAEKLEQLRWLENGYRIGVAETYLESFGIDTPDDVERYRALLLK